MQPGARNPTDPAAAATAATGPLQRGATAAEAAAAAAVGGAVASAAAGGGGGGGGMSNAGRWTDNGQPLTLTEGRTVMDQVEQAIVARLRPSQAAAASAEGAAAGAAPAAGRPGEGGAAAGGGGGAGEVRPTGRRNPAGGRRLFFWQFGLGRCWFCGGR